MKRFWYKKPDEIRTLAEDHWDYIEISDNRLCPICNANAKMEGEGRYDGRHLRAYFPYLEILDEDTIKVNEHPRCRCVLVRVSPTVRKKKVS